MIDLWKVKENFSSLVVETEPWTLAQFVMWLDLKISEYKIKGFMVLDHNNTTKPRWMSPDSDIDPETDIAPQPPPCRKCDKGDNPTWAPHLISHQPPSRQGQNKRQRFESHYENYIAHEKTHMGRQKDIDQSQYSSDYTESHPNTTVIDLENMPEMGIRMNKNINEQRLSELQKSGVKSTVKRGGNKNNPSLLYGENQRPKNTVSYTFTSTSDSIPQSQQSRQGNRSSSLSYGQDNETTVSGSHENSERNTPEGVVSMYLHTSVGNNENAEFSGQKDRGGDSEFVLAEVKQEDFESSIADMSGFDEEMPPSANENSMTSYSDDEQNSYNVDQNFPHDSRSAAHRVGVMSFAASNIELPVFEDPLVQRVLEDSNSTPSRHMWSKIISRCAYHMLSKGVPHKHDYQAFSEAFYYRYPCVGTNRGPHPWSNFAKQLSQKIRKIRWSFKRQNQEEIMYYHEDSCTLEYAKHDNAAVEFMVSTNPQPNQPPDIKKEDLSPDI